MLALIKKSRSDLDWISGYCGTPAEIAMKFLSSGARELYQQTWAQSPESLQETSHILNNLLNTADSGQTTRSDIENIDLHLSDWSYQCLGCAESQAEAIAICDLLEHLNAGNTCTSSFRKKQYAKFIEVMKTRYPDISNQETNQILSAAMNLKL